MVALNRTNKQESVCGFPPLRALTTYPVIPTQGTILMTQHELKSKADQLFDLIQDLRWSNSGDEDVDFIVDRLSDCRKDLNILAEDYQSSREVCYG